MNRIKRFIRRFKFAWGYAYETKKWLSFSQNYGIKDPLKGNNKGEDV